MLSRLESKFLNSLPRVRACVCVCMYVCVCVCVCNEGKSLSNAASLCNIKIIISSHLHLGLPSGLIPSGGETGGKETIGESEAYMG